MSACVATGTGSYVAVGMPGAVGISPATPVLERVLGDIDSELRWVPVTWFAVGLPFLFFFLWMIEISSVAKPALATDPGAT